MSKEKQPRIMVPELCKTHQQLLVHQAGVKEDGPWRVLLIVANIALFQAMTCDPEVHKKIGGEIGKITSLGCFACYKPDRFGEIVQCGSDFAAIKALGEKWVKENAIS